MKSVIIIFITSLIIIPYPRVVIGVDKVDVVGEPANAKRHSDKRKHFHHLKV